MALMELRSVAKILPIKIRRLLPTLLEGQFLERAENLLAFGLPGARRILWPQWVAS